MDTPILAARGVRKVRRTAADEITALDDVEIDVRGGEFVAVMGPAGSGETTLLTACPVSTASSRARFVSTGGCSASSAIPSGPVSVRRRC